MAMAALNQIAAVTKKLESYGYKNVDSSLIENNVDTAVQSIFNFCNIKKLASNGIRVCCSEYGMWRIMYCLNFLSDDKSNEICS